MYMRTIRQIADEFGLSLRTLRYYEQRGLIKSKRFSSDKSLRMYDDEDRARVAQVVRWVRMGFMLSEIENDAIDVHKLRAQLQYIYDRMAELETAALLIKEEIRSKSHS